ncbi:MAG TPA: LysE family transporter [Rhizomicrobium sp.]|nr:LysE family transporter [Rhizomicrobium sp.]
MDYLVLIISGVVIGLIVAAPIGPVNLICIRRTLAFGQANGFAAGLGAAMGDGAFAIVTGFGLTAIAQIIEGYSIILELAGGIMLVAFGVHTFITTPDVRELARMKEAEGASTLVRAMASTFALTITNPATLFGFAALFAGLGGLAGGNASFVETAIVVGGVIAGSILWWFTLTAFVGMFHQNINDRVMKIINHASGIIITLFGLAVLGHLVISKFL